MGLTRSFVKALTEEPDRSLPFRPAAAAARAEIPQAGVARLPCLPCSLGTGEGGSWDSRAVELLLSRRRVLAKRATALSCCGAQDHTRQDMFVARKMSGCKFSALPLWAQRAVGSGRVVRGVTLATSL